MFSKLSIFISGNMFSANKETTHTQQTNKAFNMASTNCTIPKRQSKNEQRVYESLRSFYMQYSGE